jgi:putative colanic acid biosynthesis acetyltransferase WcaF
MNLQSFGTKGFDRGASLLTWAAWNVVSCCFFKSFVPLPSGLRRMLLRCFGAKIGQRVVIRSPISISFPWRLEIGDDVWLGEGVMILSLAPVRIESNVCVSQRAFLCSGSHDFSRETFDLITEPITIHEGSWVAAQAFVGSGVEIGPGSLVSAGCVVTRDVPPKSCARGNPMRIIPIEQVFLSKREDSLSPSRCPREAHAEIVSATIRRVSTRNAETPE